MNGDLKNKKYYTQILTNECKKLKVHAFWNCIFELDTTMGMVAVIQKEN